MSSKSSRARRQAAPAPRVQTSLRTRIVRSIGPALILALLALLYGGYLRVSLASLDAEAVKEWTALQTLLKERGDLAIEFADATERLAEQEASVASDESGAPSASEEDDVEPTVDEILGDVRKISERLRNAKTPTLGANADADLGATLGALFYAVKDLTALRADEEYQRLLQALADSETAITDARGRYNALVMRENAKLTKFPGKFAAPLVKLDPREYFNAEAADARTPRPEPQSNQKKR